jgi:serpin B
MWMRNGVAAAVILSLATVQGCSDPTGPSQVQQITELPRALSLNEQTVIAHANTFGFDLLRTVDPIREEDAPNTILSPLSASMALGMAMTGADGETFTEMQEVLGFQGMSREEINDSYEGLMELLLNLDPQVEMALANSAWSRQGFPFHQAFFDEITEAFDAVVQELDFGDPGAKDVINSWVDENTNGRIEEIVDEIDPLDILFLINAVYFKGDWTTKFKKSDTTPAPFYLDSGSTVDVPTMSGKIESAGIAWVPGERIVAELPYGGQAFGMVVILPAPEETVDDLVADLDADTWAVWMDALTYREVHVTMPKFELEWDGMLNDPLQAMGMPRAFDPVLADFSRMTPAEDAYISAVRQKTYMKVDEEGTEAAAATSVVVSLTSAGSGITVDRPYVLAIRERLSGTVLFLGAVRDPR